jgi:hypothetical protein
MEATKNFDDIRPFYDGEINEELRKLSREPQLIMILKRLFPQRSRKNLVNLLSSFYSVKEFQTKLIRTIAANIIHTTTDGLSISGTGKIKDTPNCLFISNHRDILLDSIFLNALLLDNGRDTSEIAIGDNLFIAPWVERLVRINKSIVVRRNVPVRQMLEISAKLSAYIRYAIMEKKASIWIAQREGRAKDSNDRTQVSVLKMFNISGNSTLLENMKELNITPVSISYEYDPCDFLKAKEFQQKRDNPDYKKTPEDDKINMLTGLTGWKGRVHYNIDVLGSEEIDNIPQGDKNKQLESFAGIIDFHIHKNYRIYPCNMVALDLLENKNTYLEKYGEAEKTKFEKYLQGQLDKIHLPNKDTSFLRTKILEMYANPFINYLKTTPNP